MTALWFLFLILISFSSAFAAIHDPLNIFCGGDNCYDVLGVDERSSLKDIKKSYRQLSLVYHPDKNAAENATEIFRKIAKAYDVLNNNDSRSLFDYYLKHPRDYFKVSGQHYFRALPKSDIRVIIAVVILLISMLTYSIQYSKHNRLMKFLKYAVLNNLNLKNGGTKQTQAVIESTLKLYCEKLNMENASIAKALKDPIFLECANEIVDNLQIEGGYRKPSIQDLFVVQLLVVPWSILKYCHKYFKIHFSTTPLTETEKIEYAIAAVGMGTWDEIDEATRKKLIELEVWKTGLQDALKTQESPEDNENDDEEDDNLNENEQGSNRSSRKASNRKLKPTMGKKAAAKSLKKKMH